MPFAEMTRCIALAFEELSERGFFEGKVSGPFGSEEFFIGGVYSGDKGSEMEAGGISAGQDTCSGWGGNGGRGICISKPNSLFGKTVNVWRLVEGTCITAQLMP